MSKPKIITLHTNHIRVDGGTQSRVSINENVVSDYAQEMQNGAEFPAAICFYDGSNNWLADGFHRYYGAVKAKKRLLVEQRSGTKRDAILFSVGANATHGLRRTNADKKVAVMTLLADNEWRQKSNRWVADACAVDEGTVRRYRAEFVGDFPQSQDESGAELPHLIEGRDGKKYPAPPVSSDEFAAASEPVETLSPKEEIAEQENIDPAFVTDTEVDGDDEFADEDPFADEEDDSTPIDIGPGAPAHPFADVDGSLSSEGEPSSDYFKDGETLNPDVSPPEPEPTIEEKIRISPLGQALALYGHRGYKFVESALLQEDLWKKISPIKSIAGRLRHTTNATAKVLAPVARFAHWEKWEGCPACKGEGRFGERKDPCATCETWGFVIIPETGVSADVVREHAESLNAESV
jgi:hypothetical protein